MKATKRVRLWWSFTAALASTVMVVAAVIWAAVPASTQEGTGMQNGQPSERSTARKALASCPLQWPEQAACLERVVRNAIDNAAFTELMEELATETGPLVDTCTKVMRGFGSMLVERFADAVALTAATDIRACNNAAAESAYVVFAGRQPEALAALTAACAERIGLTQRDKTSACAKALGWAYASIPGAGDLGDILLRCREQLDATAPFQTRDRDMVGYDRLFFGCASGAVSAHHGPHRLSGSNGGFESALAACVADRRTIGAHPSGIASRNGCAGGIGTAYGQQLFVGGVADTSRLTELLSGCEALVEQDGTGGECATQLFRQTASMFFTNEPTAADTCAQAASVSVNAARRCEDERANSSR